jgi:hypothetical protein
MWVISKPMDSDVLGLASSTLRLLLLPFIFLLVVKLLLLLPLLPAYLILVLLSSSCGTNVRMALAFSLSDPISVVFILSLTNAVSRISPGLV